MKAISIRAPWWWWILHGGKDIENRDWPTRFRGEVLVHASKWWRREPVLHDFRTCLNMDDPTVGRPRDLVELRSAGGCIVGKVTITDCVSASDSPWFFGRYGFVLTNPVAFERPIPYRGALGFFQVPDSLVFDAVNGEQLSAACQRQA